MRRREFIACLSGTMGMLPLGSQAQQGERLRRIGWLDPAPETDPNVQIRKTVVQQSFQSKGWLVGRNLAIDYRWGIFDLERARRAGAELVNFSPDVILCAASPGGAGIARNHPHGAHRFRRGCGAGCPRIRSEPCASGWQHDRIFVFGADGRGKMAPAAPGDCAARQTRRLCVQSQRQPVRPAVLQINRGCWGKIVGGDDHGPGWATRRA